MERQRSIDLFLTLVRQGLKTGKADAFPDLDEEAWKEILDLGLKQGVIGLVFAGASALSSEVVIPDSISYRMMIEADRIIRRSEKVSKGANSLVAALETEGIHPVIMKGPSVAVYYPDPKLRESGDLDIFILPDGFDKAIGIIPSGEFHKDSDGNILYHWDDVLIDQHPRYFDLHNQQPARLDNVNPSPEDQLLMLSLHIRKHCMAAGVGLRQICDMAMAYRALEGSYDPQTLLDLYDHTGSARWNLLLASFIRSYLGDVPLPYPEDRNYPNPGSLFKIVFAGGSFGHYNPSRGKAISRKGSHRKVDTFIRILKRLPFSLHYCRRELLPYLSSLTKGNIG